ncbi:DUF3991 domain-containing protein [Sphingobium indicum]
MDCRAVLERAGWSFDAPESTSNAAKFRNGSNIVIVTHDGRGWFDPLNDARGDVIALAQHVWGGSIGHARKALRPMAGIAPTLTPSFRERKPPAPLDAARAWAKARKVATGSQGWTYLTGTQEHQRFLPAATLARATAADLLREGIYGTVWFLHRLADGTACGWEMRGPDYKGFAKGGDKALFWIGDPAASVRFAVAESAIDALSLATLEDWPDGTLYLSTGGGFGPITAEVLRAMLRADVEVVAATDQGRGGELLAERLRELAEGAVAGFDRLQPPAKDWNEVLREKGRT